MVSMECLRTAWDTQTKTPIEKLVLVRLADRANGPENSCFPGVTSIAKECCLSERSVHRAINGLLKSKIIKLQRGGGLKSNTYYLNSTPATQSPLSISHPCPIDTPPVSNSHRRGDGQSGEGCPIVTGGVSNSHPNPNRTLIEPKSNPHAEGHAKTPRRLNGIPKTVEEVIACGAEMNPPKDEDTCRNFWCHYEAQKRTNANGDEFWVTGGENPSVITHWKPKLMGFRPSKSSNGKPDHRAERAAKEYPQEIKAKILKYD